MPIVYVGLSEEKEMSILINIIGIGLILFIAYWFFAKKVQTTTIKNEQALLIQVQNGVYSPQHIELQADKPLSLQFIRHDASACAETVVFPKLNISAQLPLGEVVAIELPALKAGTYEFTCSMGMYRGKLLVS
jgi:plastocyanin domain-containing protein